MKKLFLLALGLMLMLNSFALAEMEVVTDVSVAENQVTLSMTTGLPIDHENHTIVAQMDNEPGARPQKGVADADIVYETETYNGGYTRYTAVFNDTIPEQIEAIRSARIVHVDLFKEYDGAFVHYGAQYAEGSNAEAYLEQLGYSARYDGIKGISGFYRDSSRKAPNNVVCKLKDLYEKTDWSNHTQRSPLKFSETDYTVQGEPVSAFSIEYRAGSYVPGYTYADGLYYRSYNGKPYKDGTTGEQVTCSNVIVQHVIYEWYDNASDRPKVTTFGSNACDYFIDGMHFTGYWEREDVNHSTVYYDANGNEVIFKPGKTFIQLLKQGKEITIDGTDDPSALKSGSTGEEVKRLQQKLVDMGLLNGGVDGIYGGNTATAVSAAQAMLGMEQTGVADAEFLQAIYAQ